MKKFGNIKKTLEFFLLFLKIIFIMIFGGILMKDVVIKKTERKSNFELMRIVSMFMIVVWHFIMHSNLVGRSSGTLNLTLDFIYAIFCIHVNSFVLLSGYFQYNKKFNFKKIIPLIGATWFYKALFAIIFVALGIVVIGKFDMLCFLLPIDFSFSFGSFYWFINMYIVLYLLSPFLNILIRNLSQKNHRRLMILSIILFSILPYVTLQSTFSNNGYNIASFMMLYIIGAYFGKYKLENNFHFKNYSLEKRRFILIASLLFVFVLQFMILCLIRCLDGYDNIFLVYIRSVVLGGKNVFSAPLIVFETIIYLLLFETFNIKSKFINKVASLTFGIYLVHENYFVFNYIYQFFPLGTEGAISSLGVIGYVFFWSFVIFVVSAFVELLRQLLFKGISRFGFVKKIKHMCDNYVKKF